MGKNVSFFSSSHPDHPLKAVTGVMFLNLLYSLLISINSHPVSTSENQKVTAVVTVRPYLKMRYYNMAEQISH